MSKIKKILGLAALVALPAAVGLDALNLNASPQEESSYRPSAYWEETRARVKVLVSDGYHICSTYNQGFNQELGLKKEHCFQFEEADKLRHSGVSSKEANPFASDYSSGRILELREGGCNLTKLPDLLKQSKQATNRLLFLLNLFFRM